jgi:hypothetical protein
MSADMERIVAAKAEEFAAAEIFNEWMPPDGDYTVLLTEYADGVSKKGSNEYAWWRLTARIQSSDPELDQKDFTIGPFRSSAVGFLKSAMSVLKGEKIDDLRQAEPVLSGAVGWVATVRVTTTTRDKTEYTNSRIMEVVDKSAAAAA